MVTSITPENFERQRARAILKLTRPVHLKEIPLPAGDVNGFSIDDNGSTGLTKLFSRDWLDRGYDGVRLVGQGIDRTHIRKTGFGWQMFVHQHPGIVQLEEMTVHGGSSWGGAVHFGLQGNGKRPVDPKFQFRGVNLKMVVDPPTATGGRGKFCHFGYNFDEWLKDCILDATEAREHARYGHGKSKWGSLYQRVQFLGAGAQPYKERPDYTETTWAGPDVWEIFEDCSFKAWYQEWSDRGGAAMVFENASSNIDIQRCNFWGGGARGSVPSNARSHAIMISSEGNGRDILTGRIGVGYGHGLIRIKQINAVGYSDVPWNSELISVYRNGGGRSARGLLIEESGLWGIGMNVNMSAIAPGQTLLRGNNTPEIRERCGRLGMAVDHEAVVNLSNRQMPVSEGLHR